MISVIEEIKIMLGACSKLINILYLTRMNVIIIIMMKYDSS